MKNELEIQKKGNCKCSCIPASFKISRNDKKMNIDKTKDSINLETDFHNIAIKWGRHASPSDNGDKETHMVLFYACCHGSGRRKHTAWLGAPSVYTCFFGGVCE